MPPTGSAPTTADGDTGVAESLMTGQESLPAALGALLGEPMLLIEHSAPGWPARDYRAAREDLQASDNDQWWHLHQLILTANDESVLFYGYVATTWLADRIPPMSQLILALSPNHPFEQTLAPMRLSPRVTDDEDLGHTRIRRRVLSRPDGVSVAVVQELLWTEDRVHLAPYASPRPRRPGVGAMFAEVTGFPDLPVSLRLQQVYSERGVQ